MAIKRFLADVANGDMAASSGLTVTPPDRNLETVDPLGEVVGLHEARFDETVLIAAVPSYTEVLGNSNNGLLLASGVDANGTTALLLYLNDSNHSLDVYSGTSTSPAHQAALTQFTVGSSSTATNGSTFYGFPSGTPTEAIQPRTAVIFHGAIIVGGPVWLRQSNGTYELSGWGFAINQNGGNSANWSLAWHDTGQAQGQLYLRRGREWCMRACPAYQRGQTNPSSCFICCADYIYKYDGDESLNAHSGNAFVFRITRDNTSTPWTIGAGTSNTVMRFDIRPASTQFSGVTFRKLNHAHACVATEWMSDDETQGLQVLVPTGDSQERNRFLRFLLADITDDYTLNANWTVIENYHGKADPETGTAEATESSQPGCGFFGPEAGTILWATDLNVEWVNLMRLVDADATAQATFEHVYGLATGFGRDNTGANQYNPTRSRPVFQGLSQPRPELEEHNLAIAYDEAAIAGYEEDARRVLYCPNVADIRQWVQCGPIRKDTGSVNTPTIAIHAGFIYIAANSMGIKRFALPQFPSDQSEEPPTLLAIRPMLIGPGGKNLVRKLVSGFNSGCYLNKVHATEFDAMSRDMTQTPPIWKDGSKALPKVAAVAETGIKIRTRRANDTSSYAGDVRVPTNSGGSSWNQLPSGFTWATGTTARVRRFRGWVLDGSDGQTSLINPNKTNQLMVRLWDETAIQGGGAVSLFSCHKQWCPVTNIGVLLISDDVPRALGLRVSAHVAHDDNAKDDNYGYFVISEALDGNGSLPYPMPPETDGPDELLTIEGVSSGSQSWTLKLAGMMPRANWDHYAARETFEGSGVSNRRWPLFTLWKDDTNWLEFSADCEGKGFRVRRSLGGTVTTTDLGDGHQVWLPDSPLLVAISYNSGDQKLYVGASLAACPVRVIANGLTATSAPGYTHVRFRGAPGSGYSGSGEVCEFRWIGGEVNDAQALNNTSLLTAFSDLTFLEGP